MVSAQDRSPLHASLCSIDFGGQQNLMLLEHYQAATHEAAVAEKDWFGIAKLTGGDRASWLQGMVTNDVEKLAPGGGCYAAHLTPQGKIVAHMHVLVDNDSLWLAL